MSWPECWRPVGGGRGWLLAGLAGLTVVAWGGGSPPEVAAADIYRCVDREGVAHYTNAPTGDCFKRIIRVESTPPASRGRAGRPASGIAGPGQGGVARYEGLIVEAAARQSLEAALVKAIIRAESNFDPTAISRRGARGLMQLMPETAAQYSVADPFDPVANIEAGTRHLKRLLGLYSGDLVLALAAYNAGEQAVERHGRRVPPFAETRTYIRAVMRHLDAYRGGAMVEARHGDGGPAGTLTASRPDG